jgi:cation:H+ antiporter
MDYIFLAGGLVGLFLGGEALVRGAVGLAQKMRMSAFLIGLTVVGFGTSMPELLVSVDAALRGVPDIAVGNIVGSNIGNILLIVGLSALVWPIRIAGATLRRDVAVMIAATLVLVPLFWLEPIGRLSGILLVGSLATYLTIAYLRPADADLADAIGPAPKWLVSLGWVLIGLVALAIGARWLVDSAVNIARGLGLSEAFIGLTIVAIGTSLPELATSLVAAFRKQSEIALGNIVGSNVFNILGILGLTAVITPIPVADRFLAFDLPVLIGASLVFAGFLLFRPSIGRLAGLGLLAAYALYVWSAQG